MITNPQKKALIIGISDYTNLEQLDFCKNDGMEVYNVLSSQGYDISDKNKLVGEAQWEKVRNTIYDFFGDIESNPDDTLLFYYSGHGVLDDDGEIYLASSDIDPDEPYRKGFSFEELIKMVRRSVPIGVVVILDCCYSGSAKIGKGSQEDAARKGRITIEDKSRKLSEVQGKYILSASQALQEAYALKEEEHSLYTSYLLQGLKGNIKSIDGDGNVTPPSLHSYVYREIMSLPHNRRPRQRPGIQGSGNIVLVSYPKLRTTLPVSTINPTTQSSEAKVHRGNTRRKTKISIMVGIGIVIAFVVTLALFNHYNYSSKTTTTLVHSIINQSAAVVLYNKGAALQNLGNDKESIQYYDKALAADPNYEFALNNKGKALINLGNYSGAIPYLDKALTIVPNDKYALSNKGLALYSLDNYTQAIQYFDKVLAIDPNYELALANKGGALIASGNDKQAITYLDKALAIDPIDKYALNDRGRALIDLGNYSGAITYLDKALAIDPSYKDASLDKGIALHNLGNEKEAIPYLHSELMNVTAAKTSTNETTKVPATETLSNNKYALFGNALTLHHLKNDTGAITYLDNALAIDPKFEEALYYKGLVLQHLANYTGAIEYYDKALLIDPKHEDALYEKGVALRVLGNNTGAITYLDKALAINPNDEDALFNKGLALRVLGNNTGAITYLDKALAINPNDEDALYEKGVALRVLGNNTGAITYLDKALAINPNDQDALNLKQLAQGH